MLTWLTGFGFEKSNHIISTMQKPRKNNLSYNNKFGKRIKEYKNIIINKK